jgi:membrane-bound lytic murein transglycosylase D
MMTATADRSRNLNSRRFPIWLGALLLSGCQAIAPNPETDPQAAQAFLQPEREPLLAIETDTPASVTTIASHGDAVIHAETAPEIAPQVEIQPPPDLWRDIRSGFQLSHHLEQKRVQQELRWLQKHPQYLNKLKSRMERFLGYIHQQVAARDMPSELALLPIVESALDPYAFSHGGAAGLWQFIPATAKRFGLDRNWWYDGRRDPVAATDAGLDYLEYLHAKFNDWSLAMAGYNAGEGNVRRAQRRSDPQATFWDLPLPRETQAYVPRLLALAALVADPEAFGIELPPLSPLIPFTVVDTHSQFDLMKAADTLGVDIDTLYHWNPAMNQWATPPRGPHRLLVPSVQVSNGQALISAVPESERVAWLRIKVTPGDTLSGIAQRYATDTATLTRANQLSSSRIRAGQTLYIPKSTKTLAEYPSARTLGAKHYLVKAGDSLWTISRAHNVSTAKLMKANHVGPKDVLRIGQRLSIPGGTSNGSRKVIREVRYGVRKGDSLARIAARFNVAISEIASWNQLNVTNYLQPGQSLKLYVNVAAGR